MVGSLTDPTVRRPRYSGTVGSSLRCRALARLPALAAAAVLAAACGGCAMSYQLGSLFGKDGDKDKAEQTGSIRPATAAPQGTPEATPAAFNQTTDLPPERDLAYARAAVADVLSRGSKDASAAWENPISGARGTITPIASAYTQDGFVCRDFLASYVRAEAQAWLQGEACRMSPGRWEVRSLKPLKRS